MFAAAVYGDLGRVRAGDSDGEHKAYATALGHDGPLVFYSDPSCTGRPVHDRFCVDRTYPILGLTMPVTCAGADDKILDPGTTWSDPHAYDRAARTLRNMFRANYHKQRYAAMGITAVM